MIVNSQLLCILKELVESFIIEEWIRGLNKEVYVCILFLFFNLSGQYAMQGINIYLKYSALLFHFRKKISEGDCSILVTN